MAACGNDAHQLILKKFNSIIHDQKTCGNRLPGADTGGYLRRISSRSPSREADGGDDTGCAGSNRPAT